MPRIRYSEEVRSEAIRLVLESQTPITQVARQIGCSVNTVHLWLKQNREPTRSSVSPIDQTTFIPVQWVDQKNSSVEIVTPSGFTLRLPDANLQFIAELLSELASC